MGCDVLYIIFSLLPPPPLPHPMVEGGGREGGWAIYAEGLYKKYIDQIAVLGENCHSRSGWFFSGGTWKLPV